MSSSAQIVRVACYAAALGGLGWLNWTLAMSPVDISPHDTSAANASEQAATPASGSTPRAMTSLASLTETVARPLFSQSRRPFFAPEPEKLEPAAEAIPEGPAAAPSEPSRLTLVGLMAAAGERQQALIRAEGKAYGAWIGIGSEIEGWRLARIEADRVVIEKDGEEEELAIRATRSD
jgi:hypothetical protein